MTRRPFIRLALLAAPFVVACQDSTPPSLPVAPPVAALGTSCGLTIAGGSETGVVSRRPARRSPPGAFFDIFVGDDAVVNCPGSPLDGKTARLNQFVSVPAVGPTPGSITIIVTIGTRSRTFIGSVRGTVTLLAWGAANIDLKEIRTRSGGLSLTGSETVTADATTGAVLSLTGQLGVDWF